MKLFTPEHKKYLLKDLGIFTQQLKGWWTITIRLKAMKSNILIWIQILPNRWSTYSWTFTASCSPMTSPPSKKLSGPIMYHLVHNQIDLHRCRLNQATRRYPPPVLQGQNPIDLQRYSCWRKNQKESVQIIACFQFKEGAPKNWAISDLIIKKISYLLHNWTEVKGSDPLKDVKLFNEY